MGKISTKEFEMLASINASNPDFVAWLKSRYEEYHVDVVKQRDEISLRWAQGRMQEVKDIIDLLTNASAILLKRQ